MNLGVIVRFLRPLCEMLSFARAERSSKMTACLPGGAEPMKPVETSLAASRHCRKGADAPRKAL